MTLRFWGYLGEPKPVTAAEPFCDTATLFCHFCQFLGNGAYEPGKPSVMVKSGTRVCHTVSLV